MIDQKIIYLLAMNNHRPKPTYGCSNIKGHKIQMRCRNKRSHKYKYTSGVYRCNITYGTFIHQKVTTCNRLLNDAYQTRYMMNNDACHPRSCAICAFFVAEVTHSRFYKSRWIEKAFIGTCRNKLISGFR